MAYKWMITELHQQGQKWEIDCNNLLEPMKKISRH